MAEKTLRILGRVIDRKSRTAAPNLRVEAWDKDLIFDDFVGKVVTDAEGRFQIEFKESYFSEIFLDRRPDLYFKVFLENELVHSTEDSVLWNVRSEIADLIIEVDMPQRPKTEGFNVKGRITGSDGTPVKGLTVRAFDNGVRSEQHPAGEAQLGRDVLTDASGQYQIAYAVDQFCQRGRPSANLSVRLYSPEGKIISECPTLFKAKPEETVDLTLSGEQFRGASEYERLMDALSPESGKTPVAQLNEQDIAVLAGQTGLPREHISLLVSAAKLAETSGLPQELLYGIGRQAVPIDDQRRLLSHRIPLLRQAVESAIAANVVPRELQGRLDGIMDRVRSLAVRQAFEPGLKKGEVPTATLLGKSQLTRKAQEQFVAASAQHEGSADEFWLHLENTAEFPDGTQIEEAKTALRIGALTGYHMPVVEAIQAMREQALKKNGRPLSLKDMAVLDETAWYNLVCAAGAPAEVPGKNEEERARTYASALREQVEAAYPTRAIAAQISRGSHPLGAELSAFFDAHPDFDLLTDSVERTVGSKLAKRVRQELKSIQRLARVAPRSQAFQALWDRGLRSARQISAMSQGAFVSRFGPALGGEQAARRIHASAAQRSALVDHLRRQFGQEQNAGRPKVIPPAMSPDLLSGPLKPETPSNWTELFGSPDVCACDHGRSVLGPAAYLADLLHFIENETDEGIGLSFLLEAKRRPDLQAILLNSENADTPLPYIDLANEILEQAVAGKTGSLKRQTTWTAAELAANPEHVEESVYGKDGQMLNAVYPWNLPFDLEAIEARVYLAHLGTSRHELIEAFYSGPKSDPVDDEQIAREYLNLTETEWGLIAGSATFTLGQIWGLKKNDKGVVKQLKDPRQVLSRAGITFDELQKLLLTGFINPSKKLKITYACSCTLQDASINFASDPDALARFCRFVRLRKALNWSIDELDAALSVFGKASHTGDDLLLIFAQLQRLRTRLSLPFMELLSFYTDLDKLPAPEGSQPGDTFFDSVFFSRRVAKEGENEGFRQRLADSTASVAEFLPHVTAAVGISAADVLLLLEAADVLLLLEPGGKLSKPALSGLYRIAKLCSAAGLTVPEYLAMAELTRIRLLGVDAILPRSTLSFLAEVDCVRNSGFGILELDGLLRGHASAEAAETSLRQNAVVLQQLRAGLQKIAEAPRAPDDAAPGELEMLLRQKLALLLQPEDVEVVRGWVDGVQPPDWDAKVDALVGAHQELACLNLKEPFLPLPDDETGKSEELRKRLHQILDRVLPRFRFLDTASGELELLLRQKLALSLQPDDVEAVLSWARSDPPPDWDATVAVLVGSHRELACLDLTKRFPSLPVDEPEAVKSETMRERFRQILNRLLPALLDLLSRTLVKQELGRALQLEPAVVEKLLEEWVDAAGGKPDVHAIQDFLDLAFAAEARPAAFIQNSLVQEKYSDQQSVAILSPFNVAFSTLARLRKVALVLLRLRIASPEAGYLFTTKRKDWLDLKQMPVGDPAGDSLYGGWRRLVDVCKLHHRLGSKAPSLFDLFDLFAGAAADGPAVYADPLSLLRKRMGWDERGLKCLLDHFGYAVDNFTDERALLRLDTCFKLSQRLGVTIDRPWNMLRWAGEPLDPGVSGSIKCAARAKYADDEAWSAVARPLQNAVREQKRAALVGYLNGTWGWTEDDLYGHFLIDPEMSPCMLTSRIKQAISSVQMFVQRILLGLETVTFADKPVAVAQWAWMKNYRVWEANRKVFLFPENWIEPELRDDRSPFFKKLENELRQNEITSEYVEKVYLNYLHKLDTVSHLDIVGQCYGRTESDGLIQGNWPTLHVFGRTSVTPHVYYYRRRNPLGVWSAWEKMDLDVEGDHLLPVVWNSRLWVFWPVFKEAAEKQETSRYWTIRLASSQYSHNGWTHRSVSRETLIPCLYPTRDRIDVLEREEMPRLLLSPFENNSALFSFQFYRNSTDKSLQLKVAYPYLKSEVIETDKDLPEPPVDGLLWKVRAEQVVYSFDGSATVEIGEAFVIKPNEVSVNKQVSGVRLNALQTTFKVKRVITTESGNDIIPATYDFVFPMQGMGLVGFGSPGYSFSNSGIYGLWSRQDGQPENFRIIPLVEAPLANFALAIGLGFFVSDSRHVFQVEWWNPRVFYHPFVTDFIEAVHVGGIDGLLMPPLDTVLYRQRKVAAIFGDQGAPLIPNPLLFVSQSREDITFDDREAYSLYNWELFFHIPLLIADRLSKNQQFEAAMRWFHCIFDPLDANPSDEFDWQRPWRLGRFADNGDATRSIEWLMMVLSKDAGTGADSLLDAVRDYLDALRDKQSPAAQIRDSLEKQIDQWKRDPFKPHLLARLRITPYMKTVVMKYLDNLIAWADQLFRRDTIESINEGTQLYILAAEILGPRPQQLPERDRPDQTYAEVKERLDDSSNFLEGEIPARQPFSVLNVADKFVGIGDLTVLKPVIMQRVLAGAIVQGAESEAGSDMPQTAGADARVLSNDARVILGALSMGPFFQGDIAPSSAAPPPNLPTSGLYFCIPQNDTLLSYWDTVADRLFKIRHCLNIEGIERELPLYEPPIDPGLLVKAAAAGVDFSTVLNDLSAPAPQYRFNVLAQKAAELCQEVKALGGALLSALEKRDAEGLALLRSEQEISLLEAVRDVRKQHVQEAQQTLEGLNRARAVTEARYDYYKNIKKVNDQEQQQVDLTMAATVAQTTGQFLEMSAAAAEPAPDIYAGGIVGAMCSGGITLVHSGGGSKVGRMLQDLGRGAGMLGNILSTSANLAGISGSHNRRWDDWKQQERVAELELKQIDKQIAAAEIRVSIAEQELANHELQIENTKSVDGYMRSKFTNQDLYDWMVGQISGMYFQSYQLAYDLCKRAERAYRFELGLEDSQFIRFGYWDSLRKGLLAGEQLYHDLKRMEADHLDRNRREYEITKHVSLAMLDPVALLSLRRGGDCFVDLPEALFDLDCPGHYMRRIKSVALTIPCVAGPYTSVNCTLTLLSSKVRSKGTSGSNYFEGPYIASTGALQSVVTSGAQNDAGLFELNFRDERYLPFEGAGAISNWRIELPREFPQFDYGTITDVIFHIRYTAREGGADLKEKALDALKENGQDGGPRIRPAANPLLGLLVGTEPGLFRLLSAKYDFPTEWYGFIGAKAQSELTLALTKRLFPYQFREGLVTIRGIGLALIPKAPPDLELGSPISVQVKSPGVVGEPSPLNWDPQLRAWAGIANLGDGLKLNQDNDAQALTFGTFTGLLPADTADMLLVVRYEATSS